MSELIVWCFQTYPLLTTFALPTLWWFGASILLAILCILLNEVGIWLGIVEEPRGLSDEEEWDLYDLTQIIKATTGKAPNELRDAVDMETWATCIAGNKFGDLLWLGGDEYRINNRSRFLQ